MPSYPGAIHGFRTIENIDGAEYTPANTTTIYAEDTNDITAEIVAIETTLGVDVQGEELTLGERLTAIETRLTDLEGFAYSYVDGKLADHENRIEYLESVV